MCSFIMQYHNIQVILFIHLANLAEHRKHQVNVKYVGTDAGGGGDYQECSELKSIVSADLRGA